MILEPKIPRTLKNRIWVLVILTMPYVRLSVMGDFFAKIPQSQSGPKICILCVTPVILTMHYVRLSVILNTVS